MATATQVNFKTWTTFRFKGKRFLALDTGNATEVYGETFATFYGGFRGGIKSFRKMYAKEGEAMNLTPDA